MKIETVFRRMGGGAGQSELPVALLQLQTPSLVLPIFNIPFAVM